MRQNFDVWYTVYEEDFKSDKYLYHYTDFSKAFLILDGQKLKFSKLNLANDTMEAKPKINFSKQIDYITFSKVLAHFSYTNNNFLQLLCFTQDSSAKKAIKESERIMYSDYSGRGFARPRMWAQYANNNNGVCFVFDKSKLISLIKTNLKSGLIHNGEVGYSDHFTPSNYEMNDVIEHVNFLSDKSDLVQNINDVEFLKKYKNFVEYNYFSKLDDWIGEKEFRFLAYGDKDYYIPNIFDALVGIVIGESANATDARIINMLCDQRCDIMKISFTCEGCILKNFYE